MTHLFIINPTAGKKSRADDIRAQIDALKLQNVKIALTRSADEAGEVIRSACRSGEPLRIYACGGDGTLRAVLEAAYPFPQVEVGVLPTGSGNDFIRSFPQYSLADFRDVGRLTQGASIPLDLLRVGERISANIVSAGYDSAVAENMVAFKRLPFVSGTLAYKISLIYCLLHKRTHRFTLTADGLPVEDPDDRYTFALAANGRFYGGGFEAAPYADLSDEWIDFIRIPRVSIPTFFKFIRIFKRGEHLEKMPIARFSHCRRLKISADRPISLNLDGEILPIRDPEIEILPAAVRFILPAERVEAAPAEKAGRPQRETPAETGAAL